PRAVNLYDNTGAQTEEVDIQDPSNGNLNQVTFVPGRQQFAFCLSDDSLVHFATRSGTFVQTLDPSPFGITALEGIAFFPAGTSDPNPDGNLALTDAAIKSVFFVDLDATTLLGVMDYRSPITLNMISMGLGYIGSGELAGSFIGFDISN